MKKKQRIKYDWARLRAEYTTTDISLRALAEKYKLSLNTLKARSSKEEWSIKKSEAEHTITTEVHQKTVNAVIQDKVAQNLLHISFYNGALEVLESILSRYKIMAKDEKLIKKINVFNLEKIFSCIEKAQKGQRLALGMDNEEADIKEPEVHVVEGLDIAKI
jgi:D-serine deaminase-like pyridoxal phosphate-dependent protein